VYSRKTTGSLVLAAAVLFAGPTPAAERKVVRKTLPNGMEVAVCESHASPVVAMQAWVRAGSTTEGELSGTGVSHFIEHMIFKGTEKRKLGVFDREIRGLGGSLNALTSTDRIVLHCVLASRHWRTALDALADVIQNSVFDPAECEKERKVIIRELMMHLDDPDRVLYSLYSRTRYRVHPYRLPVGGYVEQFKTLTREQLHAYYRRVFVPNNMIFVVAGDVDAAEVIRGLDAAFKDFPRRPDPQIVRPPEPPLTGPRRAVERHPRAKHARINMGFPTVSISHPDLYALDVAAMILGQGRTSRLYKRLKVAELLAISAGAYSHTPKDPGSFTVWAVCEEKNLAAIERAALEEVELLRTRGVTAAELARAKTKVVADHVFSQETARGLAGSVGWDIFTTGDENFSARYVEGVRGVTARAVRDVCRKYLRPRRLVYAAILPLKPPGLVPSHPPSVPISTREDAGTAKQGKLAAGLLKRGLPGGATLVVRPSRELPLVSISAVCLGGLRLERPEKAGVCEVMARMLTHGTRRSTGAQLASRIEDIGGTLRASGGRNSFNVSATVPSEHLKTAVEIVAECLLDADFPAGDFKLVKEDVLAAIKARDERPFRSAGLLLWGRLFEGHPYSRPVLGTKETIEKLTPLDAAALHARLVVPSNMVISVVGDADATKVEQMIVRTFRLAKSEPGSVKPVRRSAKELAGCVRASSPRPGARQTVTMIGFPGVALADDDRFALDCAESILGGMGSRLYLALRDRDRQLAYAVGCYNYPQLDRGAFIFYVSTAPARAAEARDAMLKVIRDFVESGPTAEEMAFAKRHIVGLHEIGLQSRSSVAMRVALNELYGLGAASIFEYAGRIGNVTAEQVHAAARKHLDPDRCVIAVVGPDGAPAGK